MNKAGLRGIEKLLQSQSAGRKGHSRLTEEFIMEEDNEVKGGLATGNAESGKITKAYDASNDDTTVKPGHKAGFVNIVGNPNVGKSTLMNDLVGERISIITQKSQTTRHRIMGIVNTPDYQIVYSDTPGVLKPKYKLQESMLEFSEGALTDATYSYM